MHRDYTRLIATIDEKIKAAVQELEELRARRGRLERAQLLADVLNVWPEGRRSVPSSVVRDLLRELDGRPYAGWDGGVIGQRELYAALDVPTHKVRTDSGGGQVNGYRRQDIDAALRELEP